MGLIGNLTMPREILVKYWYESIFFKSSPEWRKSTLQDPDFLSSSIWVESHFFIRYSFEFLDSNIISIFLGSISTLIDNKIVIHSYYKFLLELLSFQREILNKCIIYFKISSSSHALITTSLDYKIRDWNHLWN